MPLSFADPKEFELPFFKEKGFRRVRGKRCNEYFWTLNSEFEEPQDAPCVDYWFNEIPAKEALNVREARRKFVEFFTKRGHEYISPRPVVARWREDLYLTIASIAVFQPHVTSGIVPPPANPLVISQPSIRLEDIDNVGLTLGRHLTSFEMAAHHAFNYPEKYVYWKDETVRYAYEFFTKEIGIPEDMITFKESWWEGGGNAGPCFEVTVGGIELATLVFMMYRTEDGKYSEIPLKIVDTGYGVERIAWYTSKKPTAFHAIYGDSLDKLRSFLEVEKPDEKIMWAAFKSVGRLDPGDPNSLKSFYENVSRLSGEPLEKVIKVLQREVSFYAVLDHSKTLAMMLADGIVPSNSGEGYLARLVARRTIRQLLKLGTSKSLLDLLEFQIDFWAQDFPQLKENRDYILDAAMLEEERFREVLHRGVKLVEKELKKGAVLTLEDLIKIYDSHGVPPDVVAEIAATKGAVVSVPHDFYSIVARRHRSPSRLAKEIEKVTLPPEVVEWAKQFPNTRLLYYEDPYAREFEAVVLGSKDRYVVLDSTLFYSKGGGQYSDTGYIEVGGVKYRVVGVEKVNDVVVHILEESQSVLKPSFKVRGKIDWERRFRIMRHHTATHIVLGAARRLLGSHVWQAGAEKTEEKARLDITHHRSLTSDQIRAIEALANKVVDERRRVRIEVVDKNYAEEKFGFSIYQGGVPMAKKIRIVEIEGWDVQACGGTHVLDTGDVGAIKIINVERIQDGVVRLEFVAGTRVAEEASRLENKINEIAKITEAKRDQEIEKVKKIVDEFREAKAKLRAYREVWIENLKKEVARAETVGEIRVFVIEPVEKEREVIQEVLKKLTEEFEDLVVAALLKFEKESQLELAAGKKAGSQLDLGTIATSMASLIGGKGGGSRTYASVRLHRLLSPHEVLEILKKLVSSSAVTNG
ncbi:MAG: alanine--tRNA ligase [Acidilobaceae archaeon]